MTQSVLPTEYAPAERASEEETRRQSELVVADPLASSLLNSIPDMLVILNQQRQIVYANRALYGLLGLTEADAGRICGRRPGEVLNCIHAFESEGGCGTTEFCSTCGAVRAILSSQQKKADVQECRITQDEGADALDLRVWATPLEVGGEPFTAFAFVDIGNEKRRQALERLFFHDILNTAGGLKGTVELLNEAGTEEREEYQHLVSDLSDELIEEIQAQRELTDAEGGELAIHPAAVNTVAFLRNVAELYAHHEVASGRHIRVDPGAWDGVLSTDRTLLRRVVGNMAKNALEASTAGATVCLGCEQRDDGIEFWVHNPAVMPRDVQLQVFQRSFSTKGSGRGLGTYSIKLLTERYLDGRVSFDSSETQGTTFRVCCPHLAPMEGSAPVDAAGPVAARKGLRILVAEDNPVNQLLAVALLTKQGHTVTAVGDGRAALNALADRQIDVVLMDVQMPEMDGLEATAAIRRLEDTSAAHTPIVAMTAHATAEDEARFLAAGMDGHVAKPIQREILFRAIDRLVP